MIEYFYIIMFFVAFFFSWRYVAKKMKSRGGGGFVRHISGFFSGVLFSLLVVLVIEQFMFFGKEILTNDEPSESTRGEGGEAKFSTVVEMFESLKDYSSYFDKMEVVQDEPLHIRVSGYVYVSDEYGVVSYVNWRAVIYSIYNIFIYTGTERVLISSVPIQLESQRDFESAELLSSPSVEIEINREEALRSIQKFLDVASFSELKDSEYGPGWSWSFLSVYNDAYPGFHPKNGFRFHEFIKDLSRFCTVYCEVDEVYSRPMVEYDPESPRFTNGPFPFYVCSTRDRLHEVEEASRSKESSDLERLVEDECSTPRGMHLSVLDSFSDGSAKVRIYTDYGPVVMWANKKDIDNFE